MEGAHNNTDGNAGLGTHSTDANQYGGVFGFGFHAPTGRLTAGLAVGYGALDWSLSSALGNGSATALQAGIYASAMIGDAYISTAASFAHYNISTRRTLVFDGGTNNYQGKFSADDVGGHIETGQRFVTPVGWLTPYLNVGLEQLDTPEFGERSLGLSDTSFALIYNKSAHTDVNAEIGAAYDSAFGSETGNHLFSVHARLGWLHDFSAGISDTATFAGFTGASFTVFGAQPEKNAADAKFGIEQDFGGLALTLDLQGILGPSSQTIGGDGGIAYRW